MYKTIKRKTQHHEGYEEKINDLSNTPMDNEKKLTTKNSSMSPMRFYLLQDNKILLDEISRMLRLQKQNKGIYFDNAFDKKLGDEYKEHKRLIDETGKDDKTKLKDYTEDEIEEAKKASIYYLNDNAKNYIKSNFSNRMNIDLDKPINAIYKNIMYNNREIINMPENKLYKLDIKRNSNDDKMNNLVNFIDVLKQTQNDMRLTAKAVRRGQLNNNAVGEVIGELVKNMAEANNKIDDPEVKAKNKKLIESLEIAKTKIEKLENYTKIFETIEEWAESDAISQALGENIIVFRKEGIKKFVKDKFKGNPTEGARFEGHIKNYKFSTKEEDEADKFYKDYWYFGLYPLLNEIAENGQYKTSKQIDLKDEYAFMIGMYNFLKRNLSSDSVEFVKTNLLGDPADSVEIVFRRKSDKGKYRFEVPLKNFPYSFNYGEREGKADNLKSEIDDIINTLGIILKKDQGKEWLDDVEQTDFHYSEPVFIDLSDVDIKDLKKEPKEEEPKKEEPKKEEPKKEEPKEEEPKEQPSKGVGLIRENINTRLIKQIKELKDEIAEIKKVLMLQHKHFQKANDSLQEQIKSFDIGKLKPVKVEDKKNEVEISPLQEAMNKRRKDIENSEDDDDVEDEWADGSGVLMKDMINYYNKYYPES